MWSISCAFHSNGRSMTSSMQHSSPLIRKRRSTDQTTTNPPPDVIEGKPEWEVEQIVGARCFGRSRQLQYRVRWTGYSDAHDTWETADDIHAPQLTADFWKGNQALAKQIAYKPTPIEEKQTNSLSISLMTTNGSDRNNQPHPHRS